MTTVQQQQNLERLSGGAVQVDTSLEYGVRFSNRRGEYVYIGEDAQRTQFHDEARRMQLRTAQQLMQELHSRGHRIRGEDYLTTAEIFKFSF